MDITRIFENNENWIQEKLGEDRDYFNKLAEGQSPNILYIGCSDSRVSTEELMGVDLGEVFVHRNVANIIPNNDINSKAVIDYAVKHLKVKHIVVCGHYDCGGIRAAMEHENLGILNPWLDNIRDVYRIHHSKLSIIKDIDERYNRLVELNVVEQCINVAKIPEVQEAVTDKKLTIHGWVFDIKTGRLKELTPDFIADFQFMTKKITEIYKFNED